MHAIIGGPSRRCLQNEEGPPSRRLKHPTWRGWVLVLEGPGATLPTYLVYAKTGELLLATRDWSRAARVLGADD